MYLRPWKMEMKMRKFPSNSQQSERLTFECVEVIGKFNADPSMYSKDTGRNSLARERDNIHLVAKYGRTLSFKNH